MSCIFYESIFLFYPGRNVTAISDKTFLYIMMKRIISRTHASPHTIRDLLRNDFGLAGEAKQNILREA